MRAIKCACSLGIDSLRRVSLVAPKRPGTRYHVLHVRSYLQGFIHSRSRPHGAQRDLADAELAEVNSPLSNVVPRRALFPHRPHLLQHRARPVQVHPSRPLLLHGRLLLPRKVHALPLHPFQQVGHRSCSIARRCRGRRMVERQARSCQLCLRGQSGRGRQLFWRWDVWWVWLGCAGRR